MAEGRRPSRAPRRFREEAINVQLGNLLAARGLEATAETIEAGGRPDVLIILGGLKLVLEGRTEAQRQSLMRDAQARVEEGLADMAMAIVYPRGLETARDMAELSRQIELAHYDGAIFHFDRQGIASMPFAGASLDELIQTINAVFRLRVQNDIVREQVANLEGTIEDIVSQASTTDLFFSSAVLVGRLKAALGIEANAGKTTDDDGD